MPHSFDFPIKGELLAPIGLNSDTLRNRGRQPGLTVLGRLKSGIDYERARVEMESIASRLEQQYPESNTGRGVLLYTLSDRTFGDIRPILLLLQGAVGLVLLIACAAVANLLLTRAMMRHREVAIRAALGASPLRLIRQFLVESSLLSILGGILGILLLLLSIDLIIAVLPEDMMNVKMISVDGRVLVFTLAVSLFTGLLSGVVPAIQSTKHDLNLALKEGGTKTTGGIRRHRIRNALVVGEIAVALTLLICAGLTLKGFLALLQVNPGVAPRNVITMHVPLSQSKYPEGHQQTAFFNNVVKRIETLPGVQSAAVVTPLPFTGEGFKSGFSIEGQPQMPGEEKFRAETAMISSSYFRAMGIPLIKGRQFTDQDTKESPGAVIIDDTMDARFWPNEESVGKRISIRGPEGPWLSVVGVVGRVKNHGLDAESQAQIYLPYAQRPYYWASIVVRTASDPRSMATMLRDAVWSVDRDQPVASIRIMDQLLSNLLAPKRVALILLGIFAGLALILSVLGIYGVSSFLVTERTREIGIRMALGATPAHVIRLVMAQTGSLALAGILIGLIGAFTLTRLIAAWLYGVSNTDVVIFAACSALLGAVALLASYLPARRAMRVDPMTALRYE